MNEITSLEDIQKEMAVAFGKETAIQVFGFISDILRPPAKELGGLLADKMRWYRFKTQVEILQKAKNHIDTLGINTQKVPIKFLSNLLDHCSWEEDDDMKERWASLLANCASEGEKTKPYISFTLILNQLSPLEAKFLDLMYDEVFWPARRTCRATPSYQPTTRIAKLINISKDQAYIICDSLIRLNLVQTKLIFKLKERDISYSEVQPTHDTVTLTYLGNEFVRNCRIPYSSFHAKEIEKILKRYIDVIAKNHTEDSFESVVEESMKIYPYLTDQDLKGAVYGALDKFIWKGEKIKDFKGYKIEKNEREKILKYSLDFIEKNNQ